jgi:ABC-type glycerol-3-phosphate transport system substrate-binding protein
MLKILIALAACGGERAAPTPIRFLHTFGAEETELFNATMTERGIAVDSSLVPFARGQQVIGEILRAGRTDTDPRAGGLAGTTCPDLIRIDATWLPGYVAAGLLAPVPAELAALDWLPEAAALVAPSGAPWFALPQTVDGLVVIRDEAAPAPASPAIADLLSAARQAKHAGRPHPLGLRVDGYWLVPWLRADGADLAVGAIADEGAPRALAAFASLFGQLAPPPPPAGGEAPDEIRRWTGHEIAYWVTGPWQVGALPPVGGSQAARDRDRLAVTALAHAPRGGQLLVVPACAKRPAEGWRLAAELTSIEVERTFATAFATVPTRKAALDASPGLVRDLYAALRSAEMLPRSPLTPLLFDDINPALAAVVTGEATADEAIEGVRRGWARLAGKARGGER